ncbi:MAG: transposase [candidate division WOR-3 bacterium]
MNPQTEITHHQRRSIRMPGYDYARPGAYFVTVVTQNRECLLGQVTRGRMRLNQAGEIVWDEWTRSMMVRPEIELDEFVVMPNHVHGIVRIVAQAGPTPVHPMRTSGEIVGAYGHTPLPDSSAPDSSAPDSSVPNPRPPTFRSPSRTIGSFVRGFKSATTKRINEFRRTPGMPVWQRNYHEHIIRNDDELDRIRRYIAGNPGRWESDRNFVGRGVSPYAPEGP